MEGDKGQNCRIARSYIVLERYWSYWLTIGDYTQYDRLIGNSRIKVAIVVLKSNIRSEVAIVVLKRQ